MANDELIRKELESHRRQLDALTLRWTIDTPTTPGWYWFRNSPADRNPCIERVVQDGKRDRMVVRVCGYEDMPIFENEGEWAGPLTPPEEPIADCP